ncbi:MAG: hypothetical protein J1F43_07570 [Muribaculaceae bacterium]|nr:hypothetical protein [Muribaculaceae bacterium]
MRFRLIIIAILIVFAYSSARAQEPMVFPDGEPQDTTTYVDGMVLLKTPLEAEDDDGDITVVTDDDYHPYGLENKREFNPSPERAVWMSALFPGLGQIYNRRFWKLPIIVGGFMGLGYATNWNNGQLSDYSQAYRDLMDNDPSTKSYMNFFPPNTKEESLNKTWLTNVMKSRRDFYRRNRDLCIISCIGLYMLCMVDAYVDASLAHFDISPDLSIEWSPAIDRIEGKFNVGIQWALNF